MGIISFLKAWAASENILVVHNTILCPQHNANESCTLSETKRSYLDTALLIAKTNITDLKKVLENQHMQLQQLSTSVCSTLRMTGEETQWYPARGNLPRFWQYSATHKGWL